MVRCRTRSIRRGGADRESRFFYNRVKGRLESDLQALGYRSLTLVRPGLIDGPRERVRRAEHLGGIVLRALAPILPRSLRVNPAEQVASALVEAVLHSRPGTHVIKAEQLVA